MRFTYDNAEVVKALAAANTLDEIEAALNKVASLAAGFRAPEVYGRQLFASEIDALVPRLAYRLGMRDMATGPKSNENVCILATCFYASGGHGRVAQDLIKRLQPAGAALLLTDIYKQLRYREMFGEVGWPTFLGDRACVIMAAAMLVERIFETFVTLKAMRPTRIILMSHPMDIVAVLAAWPFRDIVEFIHHVDHVPSIGTGLPFSAHVDVTYTCHLACREAGIDAIYAGMTTSRVPPASPRPPGRNLRMATCGSPHKYRGAGRHRWVDYAVAALREPDSELIHIGPVDDAFQDEVRAALATAAIDPERYVFAGFQADLPATLVDLGVDVYLSSYPEPGAKANLEAMMAGVPVVAPGDADLPPLIRYRTPLPRWVQVSAPDEVSDAIVSARAMKAGMDAPEQVAALAREMGRFEDYAAGRRPAPTPAGDRLD